MTKPRSAKRGKVRSTVYADGENALRRYLEGRGDIQMTAFYWCEGRLGTTPLWYHTIVLVPRQATIRAVRTFQMRSTTAPGLAHKMESAGLEFGGVETIQRLCESSWKDKPSGKRAASRPSVGGTE